MINSIPIDWSYQFSLASFSSLLTCITHTGIIVKTQIHHYKDTTKYKTLLYMYSSYIMSRGGHSHWKGVWGCAAVMTPFFQASRRSLAHQFTLNAPLLCTLFSIFRKFLHFQPCFGPNSSSLNPNFSKFSFSRPPFFQKNPLPRPYIFKPAWHTPTKKKVECPPPPALCT